MKQYVIAIDQGTTSSRTIIFDKKGTIISESQREIPMIYQKENFVEQEAFDIWSTVLTTMADCMLRADIDPTDVNSIGITNQRETTIMWNRDTGKPIYKAIVWQSKQSSMICDELREAGYNELFHSKTGLLIDPYFSATKIKWILDNVSGAKELMNQGKLMFGTVDTWLLYKLTGGVVHKTDHTNASRTLLYNIHDKQWDVELCGILGINPTILPEVCDSNSVFGMTTNETFFGHQVSIAGILGDQQAALFGQLCTKPGSIKNTYGTGCFMLMNTGEKAYPSSNGLLTTIAYSMDGIITYALEGSVFVAGSAIQWLRDALEFFNESKDSELLAQQAETNYGVYVVPAFVGLGTPYWDADAKGAMFGLTRGTTKQHITRATLESLAYQTKDIIDVMAKESSITPTFLKVDGGASANNFLMQFQSDLLDIPIIRPTNRESTALGAAYMSGLATGYFQDLAELHAIQSTDQEFLPQMTASERNRLYKNWMKAVKATIQFTQKNV